MYARNKSLMRLVRIFFKFRFAAVKKLGRKGDNSPTLCFGSLQETGARWQKNNDDDDGLKSSERSDWVEDTNCKISTWKAVRCRCIRGYWVLSAVFVQRTLGVFLHKRSLYLCARITCGFVYKFRYHFKHHLLDVIILWSRRKLLCLDAKFYGASAWYLYQP